MAFNKTNIIDLPLKIFVKETNNESKEFTTKKVSKNLGFQGLEAKIAYEETINNYKKSDKSKQTVKQIAQRKRKKPEESAQIHIENVSVNSIFKAIENNDLKFLQINLHTNNINISDGFGWTPLMSAAYAGNFDIVNFLLKLGAKTNIKDKSGFTAATLASRNKFTNIVSLLERNNSQLQKSDESISLENSNTSRTENSDKLRSKNSTELDKTRKCAENKNYHCNVCNADFENTNRIKHESSIVHIFNTKPKVPGAHYLVPKGSKGYQMLINSGWNEEKGLGPSGEGRKYPIKTTLKQDRKGLGLEEKNTAKVTHFKPGDRKAVKRSRTLNSRTLKKRERESHLQREARREKALRIALS